MFVALLAVTFLVAAAISTIPALLFARPVNRILSRLVSEEMAPNWRRYILFAIYVTGITGGIRLWDMDKYITPDKEGRLLQLTSDRWMFEIYKTVVGSLQGVAWMLLLFFLFTLVAYVVVRGFEMKRQGADPAASAGRTA
jgi:hypothetical protein